MVGILKPEVVGAGRDGYRPERYKYIAVGGDLGRCFCFNERFSRTILYIEISRRASGIYWNLSTATYFAGDILGPAAWTCSTAAGIFHPTPSYKTPLSTPSFMPTTAIARGSYARASHRLVPAPEGDA